MYGVRGAPLVGMDVLEANKQVKEPPPVPILTYKWEDIRRARRKGGYPWTYLDKRPFDDNNLDDFKTYKMDKLRKTKSSADMEANGVTIEEIVDEPSKQMDTDAEENKENLMVESKESSADVSISQYLDKDDKETSSEEILDSPAPGPSSKPVETIKTDTLRSQRAKSEEPGRKRKHSIESSYSRISKYSLSRMGFMKKLKEAKDKIRLPKFSFTKSEPKLNKKSKIEESAPSAPKPPTDKKEASQSKKVAAPKYIHIPLKPPPGETDEFSHLEFEGQPEKTGRDVSPIVEESKEEVPETPQTPTASGVQLIILTAPSDDEILDNPSVPETPSEVDNKFFEPKGFDQLKSMAKDAADKYSPETKRKAIAAVKEADEAAAKKALDEEAAKKALNEEAKSKSELQEEKVVKMEPVAKEKLEDKKKEEPIVVDKPPSAPPVDEKGAKKKKKVVKKDKSKDKPAKDEQKVIETQKTDDDKIEEQKIQKQTSEEGPKKPSTAITDKEIESLAANMTDKDFRATPKSETTKLTIDEEDGLKTETIIAQMIEDDLKEIEELEKSKAAEEVPVEMRQDEKARESPVLKKKVSFKRRSKEDSDGIYEDVQITTEPVLRPENKADLEDDYRAPSPTPNLLIDEKMTKIHKERVKGMSIAEEYDYWCRVNCNDYEPINPPSDEFQTISQYEEGRPKKPSTPITDSDIEFLAAKVTDMELRTTGIITITNKEDTSGALFVPLESALKVDTQSTKSDKEGKEEGSGHGKKIQEAIQKQASNLKRQASIISKKAGDQAEKLQTRVKSIKKPKAPAPEKEVKSEKPKLPKLKIDKPRMPKFKIEKPKMPNFSNVKLPEKMKNISLSLPRRGKRSARRPTSTESTAGDSEKRTIFDFSTYPRIFRKKKRDDDGEEIHTPRTGTDITPVSERTTLPRFKFTSRWKGKFTEQPTSSGTIDTANSLKSKDSERSETQGSVRIPLHSEGSMDRESLDLRTKTERDIEEYREDSVERRMRMASTRYEDDIDMNDAYLKENQEIHRASSLNAKFSDRWNHGTFHEKDHPEQMVTDLDEVEKPTSILKKKIENIHAGSSDDIHRRGVLEEINSDEFFLRQKGISQDNIEVGAYLSSEIREAFRTPNNALSQLETALPEAPKRRPLKKPKRKKTPHVSQEGIQYDQESIHTEPDEYPKYRAEDYEIKIQPARPKRKSKKKEDDNLDMKYIEDQIMSHEDYLDQHKEYFMYENEQMRGIEQPGIMVSNAYQAEHYYPDDDVPEAPPRKHKSLRSLNAMSEHDSITGEMNGYKEIQQDVNQFEHEYQIPTPDQPPKRPFRTRSRTRSRSRGTTLPDEETLAREMLSASQQSLTCNEEPCQKVCCDYMGYSVIDKSQICDPPLPPCRRRSLKSEGPDNNEEGFFTVPRSSTQGEPVRPLRNYSTLGPSRPPRKHSVPNLTDEEKNTVSQYDEIEDHTKNLKSGEVIQKMKDRPLPAPPRPPRKSRDRSRGSRMSERSTERSHEEEFGSGEFEELEASVQTEPLPDDFECEELVRDSNDRIITPTVDKYAQVSKPRNVREFEHQETITHGSLIVQPFAHDEEIPEGPIEVFSKSTDRIITVKREAGSDRGTDYDETSEIPEDFKKLQSPPVQAPPQVIERIIEKHIPIQMELPSQVEVLKAQKLQVADLDVDRLAVNELHASKIKVGEIESSSINVNEINSNSGNLIVSGIELPASFFQQLVEKLQEQAEHVAASRPPAPAEEPVHLQTPLPPKVETKESETNTDTYLEPSTHTQQQKEIGRHTFQAQRAGPSDEQVVTERHARAQRQITDHHLETRPPTHSEYSLREHIGQEIDDVIAAARDAIIQDLEQEDEEENDKSGKKKTPFEVRLVEVESVTPQRPPRAVKVETESVDEPPPSAPQPPASESEPTPPPRPPQPDSDYVPSQPPASFYALRSPPAFKDFDIDDDIPLAPRRRRHHHHQHHKAPPESSSDDIAPSRRRHRTPEPSITELSGQLTRACYTVAERSLKRLIQQITDYVMGQAGGKHEVNVAVVILIVFIALLFLIGWNGDGKQIHHHHWEYFNPPRDI